MLGKNEDERPALLADAPPFDYLHTPAEAHANKLSGITAVLLLFIFGSTVVVFLSLSIILFVTVFGLANIYVKALNRVKNR